MHRCGMDIFMMRSFGKLTTTNELADYRNAAIFGMER